MKLTLSLISLVLFGMLYLQWRGWPPDAPEPPQAAAAAEIQPPAADTPSADNLLPPLPAKEDYASVIERPLFLPDRRPPPDEPDEEEIPEPEQLSDLAGTDLTAVVITPSTVSAWVRLPKQRETQRLRLGDDLEGWTVKTIEPDRLVLERQGETDELILRDYANAPAFAPPPPTPVARRQPAGRQQRAPPSPTTTTGGNLGAAPPARRQQPPRAAKQ